MFSRVIIFSFLLFCFGCKLSGNTLNNFSVGEQHKPIILELIKKLQLDEILSASQLIDESNFNIDMVDDNGRTLLIAAIVSEDYSMAEKLLKVGADPNYVPSGKYRSAMGWAAQYKNTKYLELLLNYNGNPNLFNKNDRTAAYPILNAISANRLDNLKLLIRFGADLDLLDERGLTPLMYGAAASSWEMVYVMLEAGADISIKNEWNESLSTYIAMPDLGTKGEALGWKNKVAKFVESSKASSVVQKNKSQP